VNWFKCWKKCRQEQKDKKILDAVERALYERRMLNKRDGWLMYSILCPRFSDKIATDQDLGDINSRLYKVEKKSERKRR